jgi:fructokinase
MTAATPEPLIAVVGEALIDAADDEQGVRTERVGGSPLNVAIGLCRLGSPTALLARFSRDERGRRLRRAAVEAGIDLSCAYDVDEPSTLALVSLDVDGVARYEFTVAGTADFVWTAAELTVPDSTRILHFGSLASWLPPGDAVLDRWLDGLHTGLLISYDPNVRPQLQRDPAKARKQVEHSLRHAHLVKASGDDLSYLYGGLEPTEVARHWLRLGPRVVLVTLGADGALAVTGRSVTTRPGPQAAVADTVGAGDAFSSGLLDALVRRGIDQPDRLAEADDALADAMDEASTVAALTCARVGADPPTRAEVGDARFRVEPDDAQRSGKLP